jgi:hypothetical protein
MLIPATSTLPHKAIWKKLLLAQHSRASKCHLTKSKYLFFQPQHYTQGGDCYTKTERPNTTCSAPLTMLHSHTGKCIRYPSALYHVILARHCDEELILSQEGVDAVWFSPSLPRSSSFMSVSVGAPAKGSSFQGRAGRQSLNRVEKMLLLAAKLVLLSHLALAFDSRYFPLSLLPAPCHRINTQSVNSSTTPST